MTASAVRPALDRRRQPGAVEALPVHVGVASGAIALTLGAVVGVLAAYLGGRFEQIVMRIVDIQLGFPAILTGARVLLWAALVPLAGPSASAPAHLLPSAL